MMDMESCENFKKFPYILTISSSQPNRKKGIPRCWAASEEANLKLKPQNCVFLVEKITLLGHYVDGDGVHVDPGKVRKVVAYPRSTNVAQPRTFLRLSGYYRKFILNF